MPRDPKLIDNELVKQVKLGNKTAFNILVRNHQRGVYAFIFSMIKDHDGTDDVVQETFVKAYKNIDSFEGKSSFKSWLYRIAINNAKNMIRASKLTVNYEEVILKASTRVGKNIEEEETQKILAKIIETLPSKQKLALTLRIFDDLPFNEIAEIMACPYDTAKANFRHAINALRKESKILSLIKEVL